MKKKKKGKKGKKNSVQELPTVIFDRVSSMLISDCRLSSALIFLAFSSRNTAQWIRGCFSRLKVTRSC